MITQLKARLLVAGEKNTKTLNFEIVEKVEKNQILILAFLYLDTLNKEI